MPCRRRRIAVHASRCIDCVPLATLGFIALFVGGCRWESPTEPIVPQCASPAPFYQSQERAPGYIVSWRDGIDGRETVKRCEARYDFHAQDIWEALHGFSSQDLTLRAIAGLRCEPDVSSVSENGIAHGGAVGNPAATSPAGR